MVCEGPAQEVSEETMECMSYLLANELGYYSYYILAENVAVVCSYSKNLSEVQLKEGNRLISFIVISRQSNIDSIMLLVITIMQKKRVNKAKGNTKYRF